MGHKLPDTKVSADRSRWSKQSQNTYSIINFYSDREFDCRKCGAHEIWTASEQKRDFEERGVYIHTRHVLCQKCFKAKLLLEKQLDERSKQWQANKTDLSRNLKFVREWRSLLEEAPSYGSRANIAQIKALKKLEGRVGATSA